MENKDKKVDFNNLEKEDNGQEERNTLMLFGRNVAEIPCFRSSFLYGGGGGIGVGLMTFLATSRPQMSTHIGFGTFFLTTIAYWLQCRYSYSQDKFYYSQLQPLMRKQALYEGTALEREIKEKSEDV